MFSVCVHEIMRQFVACCLFPMVLLFVCLGWGGMGGARTIGLHAMMGGMDVGGGREPHGISINVESIRAANVKWGG